MACGLKDEKTKGRREEVKSGSRVCETARGAAEGKRRDESETVGKSEPSPRDSVRRSRGQRGKVKKWRVTGDE